jgi:hypothetical protein
MKNLLEQGQVHFSKLKEFRKSELPAGIKDEKEGHIQLNINQLCIAEIIKDDAEAYVTGKTKIVSGDFHMDLTNESIDQTMIYSMYCSDLDPASQIIKVHDFKKLIMDFREYDCAVVIIEPRKFLSLLIKNRIE